MYQGEAISVLTRAWQLTGDERFLDAAQGCLLPFTRMIVDQGVTHPFRGDNKIKWYEEVTRLPIGHILNGMIYALWGIRDLKISTGDELANELFEEGIQSVELALNHFDSGFWSYNTIGEDDTSNYIASMMYHNLHIVQLNALHEQTGKQLFRDTANRFNSYGLHAANRIRAGMVLFRQKMKS